MHATRPPIFIDQASAHPNCINARLLGPGALLWARRLGGRRAPRPRRCNIWSRARI